MNKFFIATLVFFLVGPAFAQDRYKADTALYFYQSLSVKNYKSASKYVIDTKSMLSMSSNGMTISVEPNSFRVKKVTKEGVIMVFSQFCYPDIEQIVYLDLIGRYYKVDFNRTLRESIKSSSKKTKPNREHCYNFYDRPLSGTFNDMSWVAKDIGDQVIQFSSGAEKRVAILNEKCDELPYCMYESKKTITALYIDKLDLTGTGGNLNNTENVRIYRAPNYNETFSEGSYRVTQLGNGRVKLELSLPKKGSSELNGYFEFDLP